MSAYPMRSVNNRDLNRFMAVRDAEVEALRARVKELEAALEAAQFQIEAFHSNQYEEEHPF